MLFKVILYFFREQYFIIYYKNLIMKHILFFQLKAIVIDDSLEILHQVQVQFDNDLPEFRYSVSSKALNEQM